MADKNSGWKCTHSAWIQSQTDTTATIRVVVNWQNVNWTYNINFVSAWVYCNGSEYKVFDNGNVNAKADMNQTLQLGYHDFVINKGTAGQNISCYAKITSNSSYVSGDRWSEAANVWVEAKPSYTVSYNLNGGSGSFGNQTKWYGTDLKLHTASPTRTGHSFVRWNTNTSNTGTGYAPGATYTGNANLTLYAIWKADTYTVTYNANGGTGAPGNQTKTYGVDLTLSSTKPTRTNYNFKGWATSASGSVVYAAGAKYTNNSAVTLYAVWELAYAKPRITSFTANRCTSNGTISETGTYVKVTFNWATDKTVTAVKIQHKLQTTTTWTTTNVTASGTSGSVSQVIGGGAISTESSYHVRAYVADGSGDAYTTYSSQVSIGTVKFPIDVKSGGKGVAIGKVAETEDLFDVGWKSKFRDKITAIQGTTVHTMSAGGGTSGFMHACTITISGTYNNQDIWFKVLQRNRSGEIVLRFASANSNDPGLSYFAKTGSISAYIIKSTTSTWNMYIQKSESYDNIEIAEFHKGTYNDKVSIAWMNATVAELPEGCTIATLHMMRTASSKTHTNHGTNGTHVPTMDFLSFWNGAHNSSNGSNLTYCAGGTIRRNNYFFAYWDRQFVTVSTSWSRVYFGNVTRTISNGDKFTMANNIITVGAGVTRVKISAMCAGFQRDVAVGDKCVGINVGNLTYNVNYSSHSGGNFWSGGGGGSIIAEVSQGTKISIDVMSDGTGSLEHLGASISIEDLT